MKAEDVAHFRKLLLSIREKLVGKVDSMQGEALKDPDRMHQATCLMSQFIWQTLVQIIMKENL